MKGGGDGERGVGDARGRRGEAAVADRRGDEIRMDSDGLRKGFVDGGWSGPRRTDSAAGSADLADMPENRSLDSTDCGDGLGEQVHGCTGTEGRRHHRLRFPTGSGLGERIDDVFAIHAVKEEPKEELDGPLDDGIAESQDEDVGCQKCVAVMLNLRGPDHQGLPLPSHPAQSNPARCHGCNASIPFADAGSGGKVEAGRMEAGPGGICDDAGHCRHC